MYEVEFRKFYFVQQYIIDKLNNLNFASTIQNFTDGPKKIQHNNTLEFFLNPTSNKAKMCSPRESPTTLDIRVNEYVLMIQLVYVIIKPRNNKKKEEVARDRLTRMRGGTVDWTAH
ncbi:hypothetical protein Ddc_08135 [Ditylenchus destructor]|nr:hypothetical protein Ddc_08135 [Ditylenchus destructor]